jgi:SAM-dependent methyltransferase
MRVLEIGCGPGATARAISHLIGGGHILAIDRSEKAIVQAKKNSKDEVGSGQLRFHRVAIEDFELKAHEKLFDLAFAVRVGALDGRHPEAGKKAFRQLAKALKPEGRLFIDGGNPLKEISLAPYR